MDLAILERTVQKKLIHACEWSVVVVTVSVMEPMSTVRVLLVSLEQRVGVGDVCVCVCWLVCNV